MLTLTVASPAGSSTQQGEPDSEEPQDLSHGVCCDAVPDVRVRRHAVDGHPRRRRRRQIEPLGRLVGQYEAHLRRHRLDRNDPRAHERDQHDQQHAARLDDDGNPRLRQQFAQDVQVKLFRASSGSVSNIAQCDTADSASLQTVTCSLSSSVDFSSNNYWVEIRVTRTSTAGTAPFLQSIKIY